MEGGAARLRPLLLLLLPLLLLLGLGCSNGGRCLAASLLPPQEGQPSYHSVTCSEIFPPPFGFGVLWIGDFRSTGALIRISRLRALLLHFFWGVEYRHQSFLKLGQINTLAICTQSLVQVING